LAFGGGVTGLTAFEVEGLSLGGKGVLLLLAIGGRFGAGGAGVGLDLRGGGLEGGEGRDGAAARVAGSRVAPRAVAGKGSPDVFVFSFAGVAGFLPTLWGKSVRGGAGWDRERDFSRDRDLLFSPRRGFLVVETQSLVLVKWRKAM